MKTKTTKNIVSWLIWMNLAFAGAYVHAENAAPEVPGMAEGFFCKYNPGKDRDDLLSARDNFLKVSEKNDSTPAPSFVWHLLKGSAPVDFIWLSYHESPIAYGNSLDATASNAAVQAAIARFDTVATCGTGLALARPIVEAELNFTGPSYIISDTCKVHDNLRQGDMDDLRGHIQSVFSSMDALQGVPVFQLQPITGDADTPDVVMFSVHESATAWATRAVEYYGSDEGQSLERHREKLMSCSTGHFSGEQMVPAG